MRKANSTPYQGLGDKLRHCRTKAGLSQMEMAQAIGLKPSGGPASISNWERGLKRPSLSWIEAYAVYFHEDLGWFFAGKAPEAAHRKHSCDFTH